MHVFINIREDLISDTSYRHCGCKATTLDDLMSEALAGSGESLTASFDPDELCKHPQAYDFLNEYGAERANCAGAGVKALYEFAGVKFTVLADNTVVAEQE